MIAYCYYIVYNKYYSMMFYSIMLRFCMVALSLMLNYYRTVISENFGLIEVFIIFVPEKNPTY